MPVLAERALARPVSSFSRQVHLPRQVEFYQKGQHRLEITQHAYEVLTSGLFSLLLLMLITNESRRERRVPTRLARLEPHVN